MYPAAFEYSVAESVSHATDLLCRYGEGAKILSGGQSLVPLLKLRLLRPTQVIDIARIPGLQYVRDEGSALSIGALTTHAQVLEAPIVQQRFPLMADAAGAIGDAQVRGWGTVGGALAEADPAGDWGPVVLALGGEVRCANRSGDRGLNVASFFLDAYTTGLADDELITELKIPLPSARSTGAYLKLERRAGDFAVVSVAVQLDLDEKGSCWNAGVALGAAGLVPVKVTEAEALLRGQVMSSGVISEAAEKVFDAAEPLADIRGSEAYKKAACRTLFKKAVHIALQRFRGETVEAGHVR